ncbi:Clavaminate synthase-like protein [Aureobasidium pullulans]|nr:Clavaminate synthase-like protein [Aureobasidium pullulans]TIA24231.1 Clavaminate synthase-like protein [Aureobasidium pullulans]
MAVNLFESGVQTASPVSFKTHSSHDFVGSVPFDALEEAFGPDSLGIIVVRDLPSDFVTMRKALLSYSSYLANLPQAELEKLENPESSYLVGWSCGKETLKDGRYDTLKGSYYANPVQNPALHKMAIEKFPNLPEYNAANIWPSNDLLPEFEPTFQNLCTFIVDTAALVARACDRYALKNIPQYQEGYLEHVVKTSISTKARLLHYFPSPATNDNAAESSSDDWCATHLDHGCLTGLTSAMFIDEAANPPHISSTEVSPLPELSSPPDPAAGLYIHSRSGKVTKVNIPKDCLAFQTGEALEVITKGKFRAVPHFVKGAAPGKGGQVARNTLAVFTQPNLWELVDEKRDFATFAKEIVERNH